MFKCYHIKETDERRQLRYNIVNEIMENNDKKIEKKEDGDEVRISKKKIILSIIAIVIATIIATTFVLTKFGFVGFLPSSEYRKYKKIIALRNVVEEDFYQKPNDKELEDGMAKGLFYGLDDVYSAYYNKDEMKQLTEMTSGKYVGVGMVVSADKKTGSIKVERLIPNSPAVDAGVKPGDYIIKVNGKPYGYQEMDIAVKNMRGQEGTSATITFLRDGKMFDKKITRREIKMQSISSKILDKNIGYIKITGFEEDTDKDFEKALNSLLDKNIKGLIIDVRDNGGGYLDVVKNIADRLLGKSVIVYTKDNKGNKKYLKSSDAEKVDIPIVILTNGNSASASEILTGAIVDNKAGISIGTTTYGKGLVQSVVQLGDGTGYKLTTAQYFTPNGNYINKKGIKPNIEVKDVNKQLQEAINYLESKIK